MDEHPYFGKEITSQEDIESVLAALQLTVWDIQACDDAPETSPFCEDVRCHTVSGCYAARLSWEHLDLFIFVVPKKQQKRIFTEESEREGSQVKTTAQIFLCYAQEDKKKIENLYQKLSDAEQLKASILAKHQAFIASL